MKKVVSLLMILFVLMGCKILQGDKTADDIGSLPSGEPKATNDFFGVPGNSGDESGASVSGGGSVGGCSIDFSGVTESGFADFSEDCKAVASVTDELNGNYFLLEVNLKDGKLDFIKNVNFNGKGTLSYDTCAVNNDQDCAGSMSYGVSNGLFTVVTSELNLGYAAADGSFMVHTDDGGSLRFAVELDNADPGTNVAGTYGGVIFSDGSDDDATGDDMRLEAGDVSLTFAAGDFALTIEGCASDVIGNYSFDDTVNGEFKMTIINDGCGGGNSPELTGAVSRDGMYLLIAAVNSTSGEVEGIVVAAKTNSTDYDIASSTFFGGVVSGEYTKSGNDWSVHVFADPIKLAFDGSSNVTVELKGPWNDDEGEGPGTLVYSNSDGALTIFDTTDGVADNLTGRVAPGGNFILLHKNNETSDTKQDAFVGVFIKQ